MRPPTVMRVFVFGDLPPYRYAVSAFADGEAFLFSSALHHYQLLLRLAATFWGGAEFGYEQALAVAERQSAKALKLRSQPRPSAIFTAWSGTLTVFRRRVRRERDVSQARHNLFLDSGMGAVASHWHTTGSRPNPGWPVSTHQWRPPRGRHLR